MKNNNITNYIHSLDGLRVLALIGVFSFHLFSIFVPSGYFGVAIFFVLAGFLSMYAIVRRQNIKVGIVDAKNKIMNKFIKLLPALLLIIIIVTLILMIFYRDFLKSYTIEAISSIFFFNNIAQLLRNESYFNAMYNLKPLTHIWALSLEMQFYIVFFLTVFLSYKHNRKKYFVFIFTILYIISFIISIYLFNTGSSFTRIYYGFDTRLNAFIIGMLSAIFTTNLDQHTFNQKKLKIFELIILGILSMLMFIKFDNDLFIIIMLAIYSIFCGLFILLLVYESTYVTKKSIVYKICSNNKMHFFVERSYIIYLIHYPMIVFLNKIFAHTKINYYIYAIMTITFVYIVTEIIYSINIFISTNFKHRKSPIIALLCVTLSLLFLSKLYVNYAVEDVVENIEVQIKEQVDETVDKIDDPYLVERVYKFIDRVNNEIGSDATLSHEDFKKYFDTKITLIGDSVSECSRHALELYFPTSYIDCASNRQWNKAYTVFEDLKEKKGGVGDIVVMALGTNSDKDIDVEDIDRVYYACKGKPFVLVTIVIPHPQEEKKRNDVLRKYAATHKNCYICDWYSIMKTHNECFMGDNTHPKDAGSLAFAQIIYKACIDVINNKNSNNQQIYQDFSYLSYKNVGDTILFGNYKIKNETSSDPIEWIVLEKNEEIHSMLLLSKYALDKQIFYKPYVATGWFRATLREWLNNEFYNTAFNDYEKNYIKERVISNDKNPNFETWLTEDTRDRAFVLSYNELNKYVSEELLKCKPSRYAKNIGVYTENFYCDWWLRTPGDKNSNVMYVTSDGEINYRGDFCTTDDFGVRPAIYIRYE